MAACKSLSAAPAKKQSPGGRGARHHAWRAPRPAALAAPGGGRIRSSRARPSRLRARAITPFVAGGFAGLAEVTVGHPFDSVKTQLQTVRKDDPDAPRTFLPMALYMLKHRGVGSFYAGFTAPAVQKFLGLGFLLGTMESLKHAMGATLFGTPLRFLVCCMICGFFESFIYCPLDLIKARLQVGREKSVMESVRAIIRIRGRMGLYLGWRLHCMKEMLGNVAMFIALEVVETGVLTLGGPAVLATALGGSASGIAYNVVPHPIDTVKSVVQTKPPGVKITAREGVTQLLREGGVRRLYSGVGAATLRSIFGSAAMFLVFAALKN